MNRSILLRSAQSMAVATATTRTQILTLKPYLRAALLSGLVLIGSIGSALAQEGPSVKAKQGNAHSLYLTIENPTQQRLQMQVLSLSQPQYTCLVDEVNHQSSYGSQLNFNGMPAGHYAVLLRIGRERYRYTVQVPSQPKAPILVSELTPALASEMVASAAH
ncbi:hypothetical protein IC235_01555 [Hymenobacter sp. BT664]|uniref:Uncharacterized protein n=1 Tax=Hymenobacter montanus TaxID=2771359 RepID=A0A927BA72_9BACT|nr:hypothetical protein [Hymenobacter montanus]MBD2766575.1 hypothetical protein [Hymenobacter montanus]